MQSTEPGVPPAFRIASKLASEPNSFVVVAVDDSARIVELTHRFSLSAPSSMQGRVLFRSNYHADVDPALVTTLLIVGPAAEESAVAKHLRSATVSPNSDVFVIPADCLPPEQSKKAPKRPLPVEKAEPLSCPQIAHGESIMSLFYNSSQEAQEMIKHMFSARKIPFTSREKGICGSCGTQLTSWTRCPAPDFCAKCKEKYPELKTFRNWQAE